MQAINNAMATVNATLLIGNRDAATVMTVPTISA